MKSLKIGIILAVIGLAFVYGVLGPRADAAYKVAEGERDVAYKGYLEEDSSNAFLRFCAYEMPPKGSEAVALGWRYLLIGLGLYTAVCVGASLAVKPRPSAESDL